ncbi:M20/M25/M40 family metallo-hydrolase [Sorangium sp. So ce861]|uniref:M20/M25/M40 family metallo-hydrolase n=1 Tax=Sorangium sp. So ce861 TaxID=3133323 RepID=UPI003F5E6857
MRLTGLYRAGWIGVAALSYGVSCQGDDPSSQAPAARAPACASVDAEFEASFDALARLVAAETYREEQFANEEAFVASMQAIADDLNAQARQFNEGQKTHKLEPWEWKVESGNAAEPRYYWVFGFRLGNGPRKISLNTHFDTVSPGDADVWEPFKLTKSRGATKHGGEQELWVGRGAIDDKGPALATFLVLKDIARAYDGSPLLDDITVELIFDTTEEIGPMSMRRYREENAEEAADLEIIFDTFWSVRAEKGIERPVFSLPREPPPETGVWIASLNTPSGPVNQLPDRAEAILRSDSPAELAELAERIEADYAAHPFDDPSYRRAKLTVDTSGLPNELKLTTEVAGAQHASVPQENRASGANPLVSLANFLGALSEAQVLADNDVARMCRFIEFTWGTKTFGEAHPELLERHDEVFTEGNGTTYALTRLYTEPAPSAITLSLDVRYAIGHHSQPWDGQSEGLLCGATSEFAGIFAQIVDEFNATSGGAPITFETATRVAPDVRRTDGPTFSRISSAFKEVTGKPAPAVAMGAGTDAKAYVKAIAAGALFDTTFGEPVNYHGIREAAPVRDLAQSTKILCNVVDREIRHAKEPQPEPVAGACEDSGARQRSSSVDSDHSDHHH